MHFKTTKVKVDTEDLLEHTQELKKRIHKFRHSNSSGAKTQVCEFLKRYGSKNNSFYREAKGVGGSHDYAVDRLKTILEGFYEYVEAGLHEDISPERRAQLDVVSDFLDQANRLLENKKVHPAPAAVLVGATLEEFLRTWVESEDDVSLGNRKPSLQNYATVLYKEDHITKQDLKDITSWGGIRNHAAHGEWEEVSNKERVKLMLEGVNLFMRKYST